MTNSIKLDLRSLVLLMIAFVGNAQVMGVDLVSILCALALFTQFLIGFRGARLSPLLTGFFVVILVAAFFRSISIGIPYFDAYFLWPIKAMCLMFLIATGRNLAWPLGNMLALAFICVALIALGEREGGRLVSIFGPNMLYRLFGFLMIFGALLYPMRRGIERLIMFGLACFGLFACLLTGSAGALLVIAIVIALFALRFSKKLSLVLGVACVYLLVTLGPLTDSGKSGFGGLASLGRATYKLRSLEADSRVLGWVEILSQPLTPLGYEHADFWYLWSFGYRYPHNLFVELLGFYGVVGLALCLGVIIAVVMAVPKVMKGDIMAMVLIVLTTGSMLSGDLSDNYGVIGLACGLLIRIQLQKTISPHQLANKRNHLAQP